MWWIIMTIVAASVASYFLGRIHERTYIEAVWVTTQLYDEEIGRLYGWSQEEGDR